MGITKEQAVADAIVNAMEKCFHYLETNPTVFDIELICDLVDDNSYSHERAALRRVLANMRRG